MNDSYDRIPVSTESPSEGEHPLDSLFSPSTHRVVLLVYAVIMLVAGLWLIAQPSPETALETRQALRVGVLGGPEADVLELVKSRHPELGLELVRYDAPERINEALSRGELEAASFQDGVSFEADIGRRALPLVQVATTVTLPLGFYSKNIERLDGLSPGSSVVLSEEPGAQGRALLVLYHYGLIDFGRDPAPDLRLADVTKNTRELVLRAVPSARLPSELGKAALVALEYEEAQGAKLSPARHALLLEDAFTPFSQVLAVRAGDDASQPPWLPALLSAYRERAVKELILQRYQDSVRRPW